MGPETHTPRGRAASATVRSRVLLLCFDRVLPKWHIIANPEAASGWFDTAEATGRAGTT